MNVPETPSSEALPVRWPCVTTSFTGHCRVTYAFCPNEGFKRPQMSGDVWAMACSMLELLQPGALGNGWEGKEYQRGVWAMHGGRGRGKEGCGWLWGGGGEGVERCTL